MESNSSQDIEDYWNECRILESNLDNLDDLEDENNARSCDEGECEAEWLQETGLSHLTEAFRHGKEIQSKEVDSAILHYSKPQQDAIKKRIKSLNNTVRQRKNKAKHRKADVRNVFKDVEVQSSGSQSRSATPDSLDSMEFRLKDVDDCSDVWNVKQSTSPPKFVSIFNPIDKKPLARAPSAPNPYFKHISTSNKNITIVPNHELFRNYIPDVAGSESLPLVSYQYVGTLPRLRSGSDPLSLDLDERESASQNILVSTHNNRRLSRSHGNLLEPDEYSFEENCDRTWIDSLGESDIDKLKPLLLLEVTTLFDSCGKSFRKRKVNKTRKFEGNVFGVPLHVLIDRDGPYRTNDYIQHVPLIFQFLLSHLEQECLNEEGLLRIPGVKLRTEHLTNEIEHNFYNGGMIRLKETLLQVSAHDISAALKKLLRELPRPLLTIELLHMFYITHELGEEDKRMKALNLLILLLPTENRSTLRYLLRFLNKLSQYQTNNKMSLRNIATIIAPSLFPQRFIRLSKDATSQIKSAEVCIKISECLLRGGDSLWIVPRSLISQLRLLNQNRYQRKENNKPKLFRKSRQREMFEHHGFDSNMITVEAPQFGLEQFTVKINKETTARDIILKIVNESTSLVETSVKSMSRNRHRPLSELAPTGTTLSCLLTAAQPDTALSTHFLYEQGGNIVQREVEHSVLVSNVLRDNPAARWRLECRHRNSPRR